MCLQTRYIRPKATNPEPPAQAEDSTATNPRTDSLRNTTHPPSTPAPRPPQAILIASCLTASFAKLAFRLALRCGIGGLATTPDPALPRCLKLTPLTLRPSEGVLGPAWSERALLDEADLRRAFISARERAVCSAGSASGPSEVGAREGRREAEVEVEGGGVPSSSRAKVSQSHASPSPSYAKPVALRPAEGDPPNAELATELRAPSLALDPRLDSHSSSATVGAVDAVLTDHLKLPGDVLA